MNKSPIYQYSALYQDFFRIDSNAYRALVRFYDVHREAVALLPFEEYFDIYVSYAASLFELGYYEKYILCAENILIDCIEHNITIFRKENLYEITMLRKAKAYNQTYQDYKCDHLLKELIRLNPKNDSAIFLYKKSLLQQTPKYVYHVRAYSLVLFLFTGIIIFFEIIVVRNFFPDFTKQIELARTVTLFSGVLMLVGVDLFNRWKVRQYLKKFILKSIEQKNNKYSSELNYSD